jgi:hypothetical protein
MKMMMTAAAGLAAVLVSTGAAMAGTAFPGPAQFQSNRNLYYVSQQIENAVDQLQGDSHDYGGHRVDAMNDLNAARNDLASALSYWRGHGSPRSIEEAVNRVTAPFPSSMNQYESNQNLRAVRIDIDSAINALNGDATDYGGYKEQAIDNMQAARSQIDAALKYWYDSMHGGGGAAASNANLRFVEAHAEAAVARLDDDRHDYGGHRVAAIGDIQQGIGYLNDALSFVRSGMGPMPGGMIPQTLPNIGQTQSNDSLADARAHLETAIDALQRDNHDYNGYRLRAIQSFQAARQQLLLALAFRASQ